MRSAWFEVVYPSLHRGSLPPEMKDFVLLEVGEARMVPSVNRPLSSWVHDYLVDAGELDSIARKFERDKAPADFVRHYEDAARIILRRQSLPATDLAALVATLAEEDGKRMPRADHPAFEPNGSERWRQIEVAWSAIQRLYWGPRISLEDATAALRAFLREIA